MEKEKTRNYLRCANAILDKLPDGAEIIDIVLSGGGYVLLYGDFDFRRFAEAEGASVRATLYRSDDLGMDYVSLSARFCGCEVLYSIYPYEPGYDEELQQCETR